MSSSKTPDSQRRTFALAGASALLLSACGGGGGSSSNANTGVDDGTPDYGGRKTPGSVTMTVTDKVVMTVTMPDISGVDFLTLSEDDFMALPLATRTIRIGLDRSHAPLSTANFLAYVDSGAYVGTFFHRVIYGFVAQGGGFKNVDGTPTAITTTGTVNLESRNGLSNTLGTIAMARQTDPNSASSQFYFNTANNGIQYATGTDGKPVVLTYGLDYQDADNAGYAVFGTVLDADSLAVLADMNTIARKASDANGLPLRDHTITAVARD